MGIALVQRLVERMCKVLYDFEIEKGSYLYAKTTTFAPQHE
jgi:hypothetical protein